MHFCKIYNYCKFVVKSVTYEWNYMMPNEANKSTTFN